MALPKEICEDLGIRTNVSQLGFIDIHKWLLVEVFPVQPEDL